MRLFNVFALIQRFFAYSALLRLFDAFAFTWRFRVYSTFSRLFGAFAFIRRFRAYPTQHFSKSLRSNQNFHMWKFLSRIAQTIFEYFIKIFYSWKKSTLKFEWSNLLLDAFAFIRHNIFSKVVSIESKFSHVKILIENYLKHFLKISWKFFVYKDNRLQNFDNQICYSTQHFSKLLRLIQNFYMWKFLLKIIQNTSWKSFIHFYIHGNNRYQSLNNRICYSILIIWNC